jgi:anhydro-N-acetylmuramic acid kinase
MLCIGLMSGTSLDGIDAVVADFSVGANSLVVETVGFASLPFSEPLGTELLALQSPSNNDLHRAYLAANLLADACGNLVATLLLQTNLSASDITVIGAHGQTVRHRPELGFSVQLLNGARLAENCRIDIACDFRSADIAAGGQGAPLVPAFHREVFADSQGKLTRSIVNIGGIANFTRLQPGQSSTVGFDTGPGNTLMDHWCSKHLGKPFDDDGRWAKTGTVQQRLLDEMLLEPYFAAPSPKSTGRDLFNPDWLSARLEGTHFLAEDVQATLLELTAITIHREVFESDVYVCGGGARNTQLMNRLQLLQQRQLNQPARPSYRVASTSELGIEPQSVEALAFAWLAFKRIHKQAANIPTVTSAKGLRILGALHCKP